MEESTAEHLVVVVEDDFGLCDLVATVLALYPSVRTARVESGDCALDSVRAMRPDMVILDIRPPKLRGVEVARRLRADPATRTIPLVAMTPESLVDVPSDECDSCVTRPYDLIRLVEKVVGCLETRLKPGAAA